MKQILALLTIIILCSHIQTGLGEMIHKIIYYKKDYKYYPSEYTKKYNDTGTYDCIFCENNIFNSDNRIKLSGNLTIFNNVAGKVYELEDDSIPFYSLQTQERVIKKEVWCDTCGTKLGDSYMLSEDAEKKNYLIQNWKVVFVPKYPKHEFTTTYIAKWVKNKLSRNKD